jgi:hypothetical protein
MGLGQEELGIETGVTVEMDNSNPVVATRVVWTA